MFTTRDVIKDAFNRSGIWTNATSPLPAQYTARGLDRLRGTIAYFNKENYLTFSQKKVNATAKEIVTIGVDDAGRGISNDIPVANMPNSIQRNYERHPRIPFRSVQGIRSLFRRVGCVHVP